jgi:hypothetical protein
VEVLVVPEVLLAMALVEALEASDKALGLVEPEASLALHRVESILAHLDREGRPRQQLLWPPAGLAAPAQVRRGPLLEVVVATRSGPRDRAASPMDQVVVVAGAAAVLLVVLVLQETHQVQEM